MCLILARIWPIAFMAIVHGPWCDMLLARNIELAGD
jgi:hypothetical protein